MSGKVMQSIALGENFRVASFLVNEINANTAPSVYHIVWFHCDSQLTPGLEKQRPAPVLDIRK